MTLCSSVSNAVHSTLLLYIAIQDEILQCLSLHDVMGHCKSTGWSIMGPAVALAEAILIGHQDALQTLQHALLVLARLSRPANRPVIGVNGVHNDAEELLMLTRRMHMEDSSAQRT